MRTLLSRLKEGKVLMGFNSMYPAPGIIERIGGDWDFVWIDAQHGEHDYNSLIGLPLILLVNMLKHFDVEVL